MHACDLLADSADWNAETWDMPAETAHALSATLGALLSAIGTETTVEVLWEGDGVSRTESVPLDDFLDTVSASRLGTSTRYQVKYST
jgi:hypothetical protein